jgi:hypothetical protein
MPTYSVFWCCELGSDKAHTAGFLRAQRGQEQIQASGSTAVTTPSSGAENLNPARVNMSFIP